jgi:hypothetical protein
MPVTPLFSDQQASAPSRRSVLKQLGIAGATSAALATGSFQLKAETAPSLTDLVQFAIDCEYLIAEFYTKATTGKTLEMIGVPIDG